MSDSVIGQRRMDRLIGSIENKVKGVKIFKYTKEIVHIDLSCNVQNYNAFLSHEFTLREIFRNRISDVDSKDAVDIIYEVNLLGDILFVTENAGLIIWMPPTLTGVQKEQVISLINNIKVEDIDVCLGCVNVEKKKEFNLINDGIFMNIEQSLEEIDKIKIDDNCSYLKGDSEKKIK